MAYRVIWSPSALRDLRDLAFYIAESHPTAAKRFAQSIFKSVEHLADFPKSGRVVPELEDPRIREVVRKPCRIV
jgi:plasmid stabilization system protein ParE